ncbi:ABC transporter substrate-binding protein [Mongoliimonas terrestris]|uniref:ABC transporter substrate-binding protein n=1 Tax=Mongoliimonas terrestris TaxID=1709001 RepID=UPI00094997C1|nr:ABC transporter substrate-binding protein [Mongoliimonas terrestris]
MTSRRHDVRSHRRDMVDLAGELFAKGRIDRRTFLRCLTALGAGAMVAGPAGRALAADKTITVANFGGDAVKFMGEAWGAPFTAASGVNVVFDGAGPLPGNIKKMVDEKNVIWDVSDGDGFYADQLGKAGYLEPIDYSVVSKDKLHDWMIWEHGVANYAFSYVLAYRKSKYPTPPTSWADLFDTEKFPGKRTMWKWLGGVPEVCMLGAGKARDAIYPPDMDLIGTQVKALGDDLVLWETGGQSQQLFLDGEVDIGAIWNTRASVLERDSGGDIGWIWTDHVLATGCWLVPKGAPDVATSMRFIASSQSAEQQIMLLETLGNGPANPAADALLTAEQKRINPMSHLDKSFIVNTPWYAEHYDDLLTEWLDLISA